MWLDQVRESLQPGFPALAQGKTKGINEVSCLFKKGGKNKSWQGPGDVGPCALLVGMGNCAASVEHRTAVPENFTKCPSVDDCIQSTRSIQTVEYSLAIKIHIYMTH